MKNYYIPPDSFSIFGFEVKFYGVIMALSMLFGVLLAIKLAKKHKIKSDDIYVLALIALPLAVVFARLFFCFFYERNYSFVDLFKIREGGLAIYGGVFGGVLGLIIYSLIKKDFSLFFKFLDICAPCLILGQICGRWGNFFNQEAYGNPITNPKWQWFPFGVFIESCTQKTCTCAGSGWHQATFFYESLWNLIGFVILLFVFKKSRKLGTTTATYLIWYGVGRFFIEGLRTDSLYIGGSSIRVSQLISLILIIVGSAIILVANLVNHLKKRKINGQKE